MSFHDMAELEELESSSAPSWLWDPLLNRICWANQAGLSFWGAETIFDILERRFDPSDETISFLNSAWRDLQTAARKFSSDVSGYSCEETLLFASSAYHERYHFKLSLMQLPDARIGILLHALTHPFQNVHSKTDHGLSVDTLPMPAMLVDKSGSLISANSLADGFFTTTDMLEDLIEKCESAGLITGKLSLETSFGDRDIQYTLKKLAPENARSAFLMVFDDVTERKRTEKELLEKLAHKNKRDEMISKTRLEDMGRLNKEEADKFKSLARQLSEDERAGEKILPPAPAVEKNDTYCAQNPTRLAELEAILDATMDGIFTLNRDGHILSMNAGAEAIFGRRTDEVIGQALSSLFDDTTNAIVDEYLASLNEQGIARIFNDGREVYGIEKSGGKIPIFLSINTLFAGDDLTKEKKPQGAVFCALVRDITQWKETETELRRAKEEAEQASLDKSSFLNSLSHEIRTPLNAILGFVDLMKTEKFGPLGDQRYKGYLTDIQTSGKHLMELTSGLLNLARMQAGKMEMDFTQVEPSDIIEQCVSIMQEEAKRENILMRTDLHEDLPHIVADQGALRQIILNLLSNSIKFSKAGSQIIISSHLAPSGEVILTVSDNGIGMNEDELRLALEPFSQTARGKKATKTSGTGLGLPLSKALAEANRAKFEIKSTPKKGTSVQIIFPNSRVLTE